MEFSKDGRRAWVANRYLDQVLALDVDADGEGLSAKLRVIGGFDDQAFYGTQQISAALRAEMVARG